LDPVKVLVVDDDESIRSVMKISLSVHDDRPVEVREADSGESAIEIARDFHPHIVLLDYWMPTMDGQTTAGHLREVDPDATIVAFSGVLDETPEWADGLVVKGDIPDLDHLLHLHDSTD
jgi:two-component system, OmpR family, response regulator